MLCSGVLYCTAVRCGARWLEILYLDRKRRKGREIGGVWLCFWWVYARSRQLVARRGSSEGRFRTSQAKQGGQVAISTKLAVRQVAAAQIMWVGWYSTMQGCLGWCWSLCWMELEQQYNIIAAVAGTSMCSAVCA